jgi:hypothetical protein
VDGNDAVFEDRRGFQRCKCEVKGESGRAGTVPSSESVGRVEVIAMILSR